MDRHTKIMTSMMEIGSNRDATTQKSKDEKQSMHTKKLVSPNR